VGKLSQDKGKVYERRLVTALRDAGFGDARRTVRTGFRNHKTQADDEGDIDGVPGFGIQLKALKTELVPGLVLERIFAETEAQAGAHRVPLLVNHRVGRSDPMLWWVWMRSSDFVSLVAGVPKFLTQHDFLLRTTLGDIIEPMKLHALHRTDA
jgi:hypothetical protein